MNYERCLRYLTETDKAYLAGLFDGEGCICLLRHQGKANKSPRYSLSVTISQSDKEFLDHWHLRAGELGTIVKSSHKGGHVWRMSTNQGFAFLVEIYDYLMIKKEQADVAIEFYGIRKLKKRGAHGIVPQEITNQREALRIRLSDLKGLSGKMGGRGRPSNQTE